MIQINCVEGASPRQEHKLSSCLQHYWGLSLLTLKKAIIVPNHCRSLVEPVKGKRLYTVWTLYRATSY